MERKSFVFYRDWANAIRGLSDEIRLQVYDAIIEAGLDGCVKTDIDPMAGLAMKFVLPQLERDAQHYESQCAKNRLNGAKGGRPRKPTETEINPNNPSGFSKTQQNPTKPYNDNDNVNDNDNDLSSNEDSSTCVDVSEQEKKLFIDYSRVMALWKEHCPGFPQPRTLADDDKAKIRQRFNEMVAGDDPETVYQRIGQIFTKIGASDFCKAGKWCSFRWVFKNTTNWRKVEDGNYDNTPDSAKNVATNKRGGSPTNNVNDLWK